jgi:glutamyl-tRNA reductase
VWATCLREIWFLESELGPADRSIKGAEFYQDEAALTFLLEILCGLHSPVLGETEVLGQFKDYLATLDDSHPLRRDSTLIPFLLATVKEIRSEILTTTGSLGYGQTIRRWVKSDEHVVLWGYGSLGAQIYPWIREKTRSVVVRRDRVDAEIPFTAILAADTSVQTHVVAAPLSDEQVAELARTARVIDLRDRCLEGEGIRNLHELFREVEKQKGDRELEIAKCKRRMSERLQERGERVTLRPLGWEDLCG